MRRSPAPRRTTPRRGRSPSRPPTPLNGFVKYTATLTGTDTQGNPCRPARPWSFTTAKPPNAPGVCPCTPLRRPDGADACSTRVTPARSPSACGSPPTTTARSPACGSTRRPATPAPTPAPLWSATGTALADGHLHQRVDDRLADADVRPAGRRSRGTPSTSCRTARPVGHWSADIERVRELRPVRAPLRLRASSGAYTYGTGFPASQLGQQLPRRRGLREGHADDRGHLARTRLPVRSTWHAARRSTSASPSRSSPATRCSWPRSARPAPRPSAARSPWPRRRPADLQAVRRSLPADSDITVTLSGVTSTDGAALATQTWTFHTRSPDDVGQPRRCSATRYPAPPPPTTDRRSSSAPASRRSRTARSPRSASTRAPATTAPTSGRCGACTGTRLASVTFTGETRHRVADRQAGHPGVGHARATTYVVSYLAPQGHYARRPGSSLNRWTDGDLTRPRPPTTAGTSTAPGRVPDELVRLHQLLRRRGVQRRTRRTIIVTVPDARRRAPPTCPRRRKPSVDASAPRSPPAGR